jgi:hypothetical protein
LSLLLDMTFVKPDPRAGAVILVTAECYVSAGLGVRCQVFQQLVAAIGPAFVVLLALLDERFHFRMFVLSDIIQELRVEM